MVGLNKLTKRSDFLRVQRTNQKCVTKCLVIQIAPSILFKKSSIISADDSVRVGFTASKKIGNAVKRNFAKRRMRALIHRQQKQLNVATDYVLIARQAILSKNFTEIEAELIFALQALGKKLPSLKQRAQVNSNKS